MTVKATGEETNDSFYLGEVVIAPGFPGPPPHRHQRVHNPVFFYALDRTLGMRLGDETLELEPGSFVCVPPGVVHTFSNQSDAPVRVLNFNTPAGWENYMRDLAAALASGTRARRRSVGSRRDTISRSCSARRTGNVAVDEAEQRDGSVTGLRPLVLRAGSGSGRLAGVGVPLTRRCFAGSSRSSYEPEEGSCRSCTARSRRSTSLTGDDAGIPRRASAAQQGTAVSGRSAQGRGDRRASCAPQATVRTAAGSAP